ncbi:MAG: glycosyltransferase family 2 protein [Capnocytophaga sp.]|nr:glycosyltransferase family 2 protein [Capnocytophaga sp.]
MKIAIVILNWNGADLLQKFLPKVIEYSSKAKIYVIDNASSDHSVSLLKEDFPNVQLIQNQENYGYAKGYNEGLKHINADVFCLLNSDVEVTQNWLVAIENLFLKEENIAVIQPKILDYNHKEKFEYAGAAGGFLDQYGYAFCRGRIFQTTEKDNGQYDDEIPIFWASGACFFIRSEVFWALNGFDEDFFAHQEEIDLCWRVHHLDKKVFFTNKSIVYHIGGATLSSNNPKKTFLNFRNSLFMLLKNLPDQKWLYTIFARLCLDGVAGAKFFLEGKWKLTWAIIKAHFSFYYHFFKMYKKRKNIPIRDIKLKKSVVISYFLQRKKYFKDY